MAELDVSQLVARLSEALVMIPDVINLYRDIKDDLDLDNKESLVRIVSFANTKSEKLAKYVTPNEVLMLVCGLLGVLTEGDSSELYMKLLATQEAEDPEQG